MNLGTAETQTKQIMIQITAVVALVALIIFGLWFREINQDALTDAREIRPSDPATATLSFKRTAGSTFALMKASAETPLATLRIAEAKRTAFELVVAEASAASPVKQNQKLRFNLTQAPGVFECTACALMAMPQFWLTE